MNVIGGLVGTVLLRKVPHVVAAGINSGNYKVYGSIIRSVTTGRIVAHLQEAGGLEKLVGIVGASPLGAAAQLATGAIQIRQNEQIKTGVRHLQAGMNVLHQLGVAQLALGAAGIGVSAVGFVVVSRKIDGVKAAVDVLGGRIDAVGGKVVALHGDVIAGDLDELRGLAHLMEEGWREGGALGERRWHKVAEDSPRLSARFERRAGTLLTRGVAALADAEPMLDALALTGSLRVASLAATGELNAARAAAVEQADAIDALTGRIGVVDLTRAALAQDKVHPGDVEWKDALARATDAASSAVKRLRDREAAAATRAAPFALLERKAIHPRDWLSAARQEKDAPVVMMMDEL